MSEDHFLTTEEVLDYLQVNLRTVYRLIKRGRIPAIRVGRQWRFRKRDIDAWLGGHKQQSPARTAGLERPRVLVVDDEEAVRDLIAKTLTMADYQVDTASDGQGALDQLKDTDFDLLITDLKMPGMDGLNVIRQARKLSPSLPIIIITGYSTEASAIEAINLGVCGYLTKPFRLPRILSVAARALGEPTPAVEV
jgi:excisionase family DNA binding protein